MDFGGASESFGHRNAGFSNVMENIGEQCGTIFFIFTIVFILSWFKH